MLRLSQYHMKVQYKASANIYCLSDCLSRLSNPASQEEDESLNLHVTSISEDGSLPLLTLSKVCEALMEDPHLYSTRGFNPQWNGQIQVKI